MKYITAGTTPDAPHVGAVTTHPPPAFSSYTANAAANSMPIGREDPTDCMALML